MAKKTEAKNNLISYLTDDINNPNEHKTDILPINELVAFKNHPFKLYEDDRFSDMVRSIKEMGVLLPIIVRPISDDTSLYEILSGHNRVKAAKEAGLLDIPAIIKRNLTDDEAKLIVTETNLVQRSFADLAHSERAVALKTHMDAIKSQGKRNDLINEINMLLNAGETTDNETSNLLDEKLLSVEKTGAKYGLSSASVTRYIRVSYLIDELQQRVDSDEIGIYPAVSLSYLAEEEQNSLNKILNEPGRKIDMKKAQLLRDLSSSKKLDADLMGEILSGEYHKKSKEPKQPTSFKLKNKLIKKYFSTQKPDEIEAEIIEAIEFYREYKKK
jgi:ParB family chromosome partitioning protein